MSRGLVYFTQNTIREFRINDVEHLNDRGECDERDAWDACDVCDERDACDCDVCDEVVEVAGASIITQVREYTHTHIC